MVALRDYGDCCFVIPLRVGVAVIAMIAFGNSLLCALALVTSDIRFQPNGYDERVFFLPSLVGVFGMILSFVGLLGVYDDKPGWLQAFSYFLRAKIASMVVANVADYMVLRNCEGWSKLHPNSNNIPMEKLDSAGVCPWARQAYLIGAGVDLALWMYFAHKVSEFTEQVVANLPYEINFLNAKRHDCETIWQTYGVKDPRPDLAHRDALKKSHQEANKAAEDEKIEQKHRKEFAHLIHEHDGQFGPDGMPQSMMP